MGNRLLAGLPVFLQGRLGCEFGQCSVPSECWRSLCCARLSGQPFPAAPDVNKGGWSVVRPRYWWRKNLKTPERAPQNHQFDVKGTSLFKLKLKGKCYNCLSTEHLAFRCSAPTRCWHCLQSGHRARSCNRKSSQGTFNAAHYNPKPAEHSSRSSTYHELLLWPDDLHKN